MERNVVDKEMLSGDGKGRRNPEIAVYDTADSDEGSLMFAIHNFLSAEVHIDEDAGETELMFERKTSVRISGGVVMYQYAEETTETASSS